MLMVFLLFLLMFYDNGNMIYTCNFFLLYIRYIFFWVFLNLPSAPKDPCRNINNINKSTLIFITHMLVVYYIRCICCMVKYINNIYIYIYIFCGCRFNWDYLCGDIFISLYMFIMFKYLCICVVDVVKCIFLTEGCKHIKK